MVDARDDAGVSAFVLLVLGDTLEVVDTGVIEKKVAAVAVVSVVADPAEEILEGTCDVAEASVLDSVEEPTVGARLAVIFVLSVVIVLSDTVVSLTVLGCTCELISVLAALLLEIGKGLVRELSEAPVEIVLVRSKVIWEEVLLPADEIDVPSARLVGVDVGGVSLGTEAVGPITVEGGCFVTDKVVSGILEVLGDDAIAVVVIADVDFMLSDDVDARLVSTPSVVLSESELVVAGLLITDEVG